MLNMGRPLNLSFARRAVIPLLAVLMALSVYFLNGRALIYFDTAAYLDQGAKVFGDVMPGGARVRATSGEEAPPAAAPAPEPTVNGSRSAIYALVISTIFRFSGLPGVVAMNLVLIWTTTLLLARAMLAASPAAISASRLAATGILAGCLGALPFYVAYVMPDILAPILIIAMGLLTIYLDRLSMPARLTCVALVLFAAFSHPSHLLLAPGLALLGVSVTPLAAGRRLVLGLGLVAVIGLAGLAERLAFSAAAEHFLNGRVIYPPFLTARLIDDGPGLTRLRERCPDPAYPTCALYEALAMGSDPTRYDAPNIIFSRTPERGSYSRMSDDDRLAVAEHQFAFAGDVVLHHPLATLAAVARNTLQQAALFSAAMTVPDPEIVAAAHAISTQLPATVDQGRLSSGQRSWVQALLIWHGVVYAASLAVLICFWRRPQLRAEDRALIVLVIGGILLNDLICGGISEPANRYGARVMLLLPMLAAMLSLARGWSPAGWRRD